MCLVLSPGPGTVHDQHDFALGRTIIAEATVPVLGVCLGLQGIVEGCGGEVEVVDPAHGEVSLVRHTGTGVFAGVSQDFKAVPSSETQQWFNSRWKDEALLVEVRRLLERVMEVKSEETFTLRDEKGGDVVGLEVMGSVRQNPSAVLMTSLINTPRGQMQFSCLLRSDQAAKAAFALRAIRDTIKLPK